MQNDLIKQSIADAKALRQSAYELAKEQIAESFGPRVQEMIRLKLSEMEDESVYEAKEDELDEAKHEDDELAEGMDDDDMKMEGEEDDMKMEGGDDMVDEATLDQMLAELEDEGEEEPVEESTMNGYSKVGASSKNSMKEADGDEGEEGGEEKKPAKAGSEEDMELTIDELKDIIRDVVSDVVGGGAQAGMEGDDLEGGTIDLGDAGEEGEGGEEEGEEEMQEITLDEILASLEEKDHDMLQEKKKVVKKDEKKEDEKAKKELKEAVQTIKALQRELNEVNLLNAKLLYVNKLFKGNSLNESQKLNVITAFDRAETVKEAKKIYETLKDAVASKPAVKKNSLKESVGFASKASGIVPKQQKPIVEQDNIVNRWQVLAGIKKAN